MSDLNEAELPTVWSLAWRALQQGPARSLDSLIDRLTPTGLLRRTGDGPATSRHVGPSVRALKSLGLIRTTDDDAVALVNPTRDESQFRFDVARALLHVPEDADPWTVREGTSRLEYHLEAAVAWSHLIGLRSGIKGWPTASEILDRQFGIDRPLLRDTAPFNTLERLIEWLGVAARSGGSLIPDPTPLVRAGLSDLVPEHGCSAREFLQGTATLFPWMPHGRIGRAVADEMRPGPDRSAEARRFPEGLSLALVRLELEGELRLEPGDDPESRVLLSFDRRDERGISRVAVL